MEDQVILRKKHPCGSDTWRVWKLGMDVGLQCEGCGRKLRFRRSVLDKQIRKIKDHATLNLVDSS